MTHAPRPAARGPVTLCECGCGKAITHRGRFHSTACRVRAFRLRQRANGVELPPELCYASSRNTRPLRVRVATYPIGSPARFAYADPPYPGCAARYQGLGYAAEVNLPLLVRHLCDHYPDGWALSTGSRFLQKVLPLAPDGVHVGAWTRPGPHRKLERPRTWEPVIFCGGRRRPDVSVADTVHVGAPGGFPGAKPERFAFWLFLMLGAEPGDVLDDLFPGSGAIARAWGRYTREDVTLQHVTGAHP